MRWFVCAMLFVASIGAPGCSCGKLHGKVDDLAFTRCAQAKEPSERSFTNPALSAELHGRVLTIKPKGELRIAAFTGPVGDPLSRTDMAFLAMAAPQLVLYLGGLGDTLEAANANLAALATLATPVLFIPGGADRLPIVEAAFDELKDDVAQRLIDGSGLRELAIGADRFAIVPGAARGRYAIDDDACGFSEADLDDVKDVFAKAGSGRVWLLSWAAPAGFGVSRGAAGLEAGSSELKSLADAIGARGGLFAYPEVQSGQTSGGPRRDSLALVVRRLGRTGAVHGDGAHVPRGLSVLSLSEAGLRVLSP
jgi:hypothetical protein